jgi:hypothetical protein
MASERHDALSAAVCPIVPAGRPGLCRAVAAMDGGSQQRFEGCERDCAGCTEVTRAIKELGGLDGAVRGVAQAAIHDATPGERRKVRRGKDKEREEGGEGVCRGEVGERRAQGVVQRRTRRRGRSLEETGAEQRRAAAAVGEACATGGESKRKPCLAAGFCGGWDVAAVNGQKRQLRAAR